MKPCQTRFTSMEGDVLDQVSEAYLLRQVAIHRRPVYRHIHGDISLSRQTLSVFIDGYFESKKTPYQRLSMYQDILAWDVMLDEPKKDYLSDLGNIPVLNARGVRLINAMLERYGRMVFEMGGDDALMRIAAGFSSDEAAKA